MSDEFVMASIWAIMFCAPAVVVISVWYWIDERRRRK